jgi:amidase
MTDWHCATLVEAADANKARKISPGELTRAPGDRIALSRPRLHISRPIPLARRITEGLAGLIEAGRAVSGIDLMKAHRESLAFSGALATLFSDIDLLLIPTQPLANFTVAREAELFATSDGLSGFLRFATPFDMSGSPTITLHAGFTSKGLPLSFQLVGRHLDEALLVRAGHASQQITDWHRKHPLS